MMEDKEDNIEFIMIGETSYRVGGCSVRMSYLTNLYKTTTMDESGERCLVLKLWDWSDILRVQPMSQPLGTIFSMGFKSK